MTIENLNLIRVIKACKASGVSYLRLGDLELKFVTGDAERPSIPTGETVKIPSAEKLKEIEETEAIKENADEADDELAHMQVEDPLQFEELLVQRELIDGGRSDTEQIIETENRGIEQVV